MSDENESDREARAITRQALDKLRTIACASTKAVAWYAHSQYDGSHPEQASVRGPFGRWFLVLGGDNGMGDPVKHPTPVAGLFDDAKFAAAAMNSLSSLLDHIDAQAAEIAELREELDDANLFAKTNTACWNKLEAERDAQALVSAQLREEFKHCLDWLDASLGFSKSSDHDTRRAMELYHKALAITPSEAELRVTRWREALENIKHGTLPDGIQHMSGEEYAEYALADDGTAPPTGNRGCLMCSPTSGHTGPCRYE